MEILYDTYLELTITPKENLKPLFSEIIGIQDRSDIDREALLKDLIASVNLETNKIDRNFLELRMSCYMFDIEDYIDKTIPKSLIEENNTSPDSLLTWNKLAGNYLFTNGFTEIDPETLKLKYQLHITDVIYYYNIELENLLGIVVGTFGVPGTQVEVCWKSVHRVTGEVKRYPLETKQSADQIEILNIRDGLKVPEDVIDDIPEELRLAISDLSAKRLIDVTIEFNDNVVRIYEATLELEDKLEEAGILTEMDRVSELLAKVLANYNIVQNYIENSSKLSSVLYGLSEKTQRVKEIINKLSREKLTADKQAALQTLLDQYYNEENEDFLNDKYTLKDRFINGILKINESKVENNIWHLNVELAGMTEVELKKFFEHIELNGNKVLKLEANK